MKNEIYLWIAFVIVVLVVALYFRYYYQPQLDLRLNHSANQTQYYPYQKVSLQMQVANLGSSTASNLSVGAYVNGNLTTLYRIYLPGGKSEPIIFNYTPTQAGPADIYVAIDPGNLYNIANRQDTQFRYNITVLEPQNASPGSELPQNGIASQYLLNSQAPGFEVGTLLYYNYSVGSLNFFGQPPVSTFLVPLLTLTNSYVERYSIASATYVNGDSAYAVWLQGYLSPQVVGLASSAEGLNTTNITGSRGTVTFVKLSDNYTMCSWYQGGWIKLLFYNGTSCLGMINATYKASLGLGTNYDRLLPTNSIVEANYSYYNGRTQRTSALLVYSGTFLYDTIWGNSSAPTTCKGLIETANGTSFCNAYIASNIGGISNLSVIRTSANVGGDNLSVVSLTNTSQILYQLPINIWLIRSFNITGTALNFTSGINNTCSFGGYFACSDMNLTNGTASFTLKNTLSTSVELTRIGCYEAGAPAFKNLSVKLASGASANVEVRCYDNGVPLSGSYVGLALGLPLNYTQANVSRGYVGNAYVDLSG